MEPPPRWGHSAAVLKNRVYTWGGCTADMPRECTSDIKKRLLAKVFVLDIDSFCWTESDAYGTPPMAVRGSAATTNGSDKIYSFGGYCGHGYHWYNDLYELQIGSDLKWSLVKLSSNSTDLPARKQDSGMFYFRTKSEMEKLCLFGGAGNLSKDERSYTLFNELHMFDIKDRVWHKQQVASSGRPSPPPCSGFSFTAIDSHRAILVGGRGTDGKLLDTSIPYILNFSEWKWEKERKSLSSDESPIPRESHASVYIEGHLLVMGGLGDTDKAIDDSWLFNVANYSWSRVSLASEISARISGIAIYTVINNDHHLVVYGGLQSFVKGTLRRDQAMIAHTTVTILDEKKIPRGWYDMSALGQQVKHLLMENNSLKKENKSLREEKEQENKFIRQRSEPSSSCSGTRQDNWIDKVDDSELSTEHADIVLSSLKSIAKEWKRLGLTLGLCTTTLDVIDKDCNGGVESCKYGLVSSWLKQCYDVDKKCPPSWRSLVKALDSIDRHAAKEIAREHPVKLNRTISVL